MTEPSAQLQIKALDSLGDKQLVAHGGVKVCWRVFGSGEPLVLIHGGHGSWLHWVHNIEPLAKKFRVLVPDLPSFGESGDVVDFAALLRATEGSLLQLIKPTESLTVAGFSFGGFVAANLAKTLRIDRLVLLGPAGHGSKRRPKGALIDWRDAYQRGDAAELRRVMNHNLMMHMLHDERLLTPLATELHTQACIATRFRSKKISQQGGLIEALASRTLPTESVWGEHDVTTDPQVTARKMIELSRGIKTQILKDVGHWVQFEKPDTINQLIAGGWAA